MHVAQPCLFEIAMLPFDKKVRAPNQIFAKPLVC